MSEDKPYRMLVYASRLMKGREVREGCMEFRLEEAAIRRQQFEVIAGHKEASASAGERLGCLEGLGQQVWLQPLA